MGPPEEKNLGMVSHGHSTLRSLNFRLEKHQLERIFDVLLKFLERFALSGDVWVIHEPSNKKVFVSPVNHS
jgi:hypothetical protein